MSDAQVQIPGTETTPVAPATTPATAAPATGVGVAANPSGDSVPVIGTVPVPAEPKAPVKVTVPDGMDATLYGVAAIEGFAGDSEGAQKVFDHLVETQKGIKAAEETAWKDLNQRNIEEIKRDPETGGADFEQKITSVNRFIEANFGPESRQLIAEMGNDPHLVKDLMRLAKHFSEDSAALQGSAPTVSDDVSRQKARYPNSPEMFEKSTH